MNWSIEATEVDPALIAGKLGEERDKWIEQNRGKLGDGEEAEHRAQMDVAIAAVGPFAAAVGNGRQKVTAVLAGNSNSDRQMGDSGDADQILVRVSNTYEST